MLNQVIDFVREHSDEHMDGGLYTLLPEFNPFGYDTHSQGVGTGIQYGPCAGYCTVAISIGFDDGHQLDIGFEQGTQGLNIMAQVRQMDFGDCRAMQS